MVCISSSSIDFHSYTSLQGNWLGHHDPYAARSQGHSMHSSSDFLPPSNTSLCGFCNHGLSCFSTDRLCHSLPFLPFVTRSFLLPFLPLVFLSFHSLNFTPPPPRVLSSVSSFLSVHSRGDLNRCHCHRFHSHCSKDQLLRLTPDILHPHGSDGGGLAPHLNDPAHLATVAWSRMGT